MRTCFSKSWVSVFLQALLILVMVVGQHGSVAAMELLDGECSTSCPCDREPPPEPDDCCPNSLNDQDAEAEKPATKETCDDDCSECSCNVTFATAVAAPSVAVCFAPMPADKSIALRAAPAQALGPDIFIPPRR